MFNLIYAHQTFHADTSTLSGEEQNLPAWWRVDLGTSYDVYQVVIVNRDYARGRSNICLTGFGSIDVLLYQSH